MFLTTDPPRQPLILVCCLFVLVLFCSEFRKLKNKANLGNSTDSLCRWHKHINQHSASHPANSATWKPKTDLQYSRARLHIGTTSQSPHVTADFQQQSSSGSPCFRNEHISSLLSKHPGSGKGWGCHLGAMRLVENYHSTDGVQPGLFSIGITIFSQRDGRD